MSRRLNICIYVISESIERNSILICFSNHLLKLIIQLYTINSSLSSLSCLSSIFILCPATVGAPIVEG